MRLPIPCCALVLGLLTLTGCATAPPEDVAPPPPAVTVSRLLERQVTDYAEFTGRTAAVEAVKVRARVWGHLEKINFTEGAEVKKGDLLFVLDRRPYLATLARAEAEVAQAGARSGRLLGDHDRARALLRNRAISQEDYDKIGGDYSEAQAAHQSAKAAWEAAKLNLDYTEVRAPIDGQISRAMVTVGNVVQSGEMGGTILTTIVSIDPVYAYFDLDDLTYMQIRPFVKGHGNGSTSGATIDLGLANEKGFPHQGKIDFLDNQVDAGTGTLKGRGVFDNKDRTLTPGLFARIRIPRGLQHHAFLVTDRAVETDQGQKILYVVKEDKVVERRPVQLGGLHDGLREILTGVKAGEQVIVDGIQRVRGGVTVVPTLVEMPGSQNVRNTPNTPNTTKTSAANQPG